MNTTTKNKINAWLIAVLLIAILPMASFGQTTIEIQVAPNVLNLQSQGQVVTIHTELGFSTVVGSSVTLNGIVIESWKADNQGNFVAKFDIAAIKGLPLNIGELNPIKLEGDKTDGTTFIGESEVMVIDKKGKK